MASSPPDIDLSTIPAAPNPSGGGPNFINPPTLAPAVTGAGITMIILSVFFVTSRLYSNLVAVRRLGWDDYFCVTALVLTIAYTAIVISDNVIARHGWDIPLSSIFDESIIKKNYVLGMLVGPCIFFAKASILLLYIRVFGPIRWIRYLVCVGMVFLFLVTWITVPLHTIYCTPRHGARWDPSVLSRCQRVAVVGIVQGTFHVIFDIFIIVLPLPVIFNLNLEFRKKLGLAAVFMTGFMYSPPVLIIVNDLLTKASGIITSGLALYYRVLLWKQEDPVWNSAKAYICIFVETYVAIIVSCSPAFFAFWRTHLAKAEFFSTLWSRLVSSRSATKGGSASSSEVKHPLSQPLPHNGYLEVQEFNQQHKPFTAIHPMQEYSPPKAGFITKSITVDQSSQQRKPIQNEA